MKASLNQIAALLSIQGVADYLNLSVRTVRRLIDSGQLRALKIGAQWRIYPADLDDFVFARRQGGR